MKKGFVLLTAIVLSFSWQVFSQNTAINDDNSDPDPSAQLDIKSTSRGFLIPRMTEAQRDAISNPATSLIIYQTDHNPGYYYYNGAGWVNMTTGYDTLVTKTESATLSLGESFVLAIGDVILTLPSVGDSDDGREITIKNMGGPTDLVVVKSQPSKSIDNKDSVNLTRWVSKTFVAFNGNWINKDRETGANNFFDVTPNGSWNTIQEVIGFLEEHMTGPSVVRLGQGLYEISETVTIDLPYELTVQGSSFSTSIIGPADGLQGKPMIRCVSDCYFKMLVFDASTLTNYGVTSGEDAVRFVGADTYNEIKDTFFDGFYRGVLDSTNAELWIFETDFFNHHYSGIQLHSPDAGTVCKVSETDFEDCRRGITFSKGSQATIQLTAGVYHNEYATDTGIVYRPSGFSYTTMIITGNSYNNVGKFIAGFDFSRSDGRDAEAFIDFNPGLESKSPHCEVRLVDNTNSTGTASANTWYRAEWTGQAYYTCKWTVRTETNENGITYQPTNVRDVIMNISGNISSSINRNISIAVVRNGATVTRYGETTLRTASSSIIYQFSTVAYIPDVEAGDAFSIYISVSSGGGSVNISDLNWWSEAH